MSEQPVDQPQTPKRSVLDLNEAECRQVYQMAFDDDPDSDFGYRITETSNGQHRFLQVKDFARTLSLHRSGNVWAMWMDTATPEHVNAPKLVKYLESIGIEFD